MIAILTDKKGFTKELYVPAYAPYIDIAIYEPIKAYPAESVTMTLPTEATVIRFDFVDKEKVFGQTILNYKEMNL